MDVRERIRRRQRRDRSRLIRDYDALSPVGHLAEPTDRGPVLEELLDHLDPMFDGRLPPNAYVHGPAGAGKSAVVTALFRELRAALTDRSGIHTATRARPAAAPSFVYVDTRRDDSAFAFYRAVLDELVDESIPEHGVKTETLRGRLQSVAGGSRGGVVLAVDHAGEPDSVEAGTLVDLLTGLPGNVRWLAVGRGEPAATELTRHTGGTVQVRPYRRHALLDVLRTRAADGLAPDSLGHDRTRRIAEWADGDAHDALAALLIAAELAADAGRDRIGDADVETAVEEIPDPCVSLGRVLALPANKQAVLRRLVDVDESRRASVSEATAAIGSARSVDLSAGTIKRFLYELAESGIVELIERTAGRDQGRPPSRVEPRFPPTAFRRLYDRR
ncbi:AAA family ATPase [Halobacteriales archaeon QS_1_68_17]|nr:MAG: AAA family ATPase [Halobacteriales archaeon QS_1_68_17]